MCHDGARRSCLVLADLAILAAATLKEAEEGLREHRPRFVAFSGHTADGGEGYQLAFESPTGIDLEEDNFLRMLREARASRGDDRVLECVFLNCCQVEHSE